MVCWFRSQLTYMFSSFAILITRLINAPQKVVSGDNPVILPTAVDTIFLVGHWKLRVELNNVPYVPNLELTYFRSVNMTTRMVILAFLEENTISHIQTDLLYKALSLYACIFWKDPVELIQWRYKQQWQLETPQWKHYISIYCTHVWHICINQLLEHWQIVLQMVPSSILINPHYLPLMNHDSKRNDAPNSVQIPRMELQNHWS